MEGSICKVSFSKMLTGLLLQPGNGLPEAFVYVLVCGQFPAGINKENIKPSFLLLQFFSQRVSLQPVCLACQPFDPVSGNGCFEMPAAGGKACAQVIIVFGSGGLEDIKYTVKRHHKSLAAVKQLFDFLPAFEPFVFTKCKSFSHLF